MKKFARALLIFALLLGLTVPATASDTKTQKTAQQPTTNKDEPLTKELRQAFADRTDLRSVTPYVDDRVAVLQGTIENYRDKIEGSIWRASTRASRVCAITLP